MTTGQGTRRRHLHPEDQRKTISRNIRTAGRNTLPVSSLGPACVDYFLNSNIMYSLDLFIALVHITTVCDAVSAAYELKRDIQGFSQHAALHKMRGSKFTYSACRLLFPFNIYMHFRHVFIFFTAIVQF